MEIAGGGESERGDRNRHVAVPAVCQFAILWGQKQAGGEMESRSPREIRMFWNHKIDWKHLLFIV